MNTIPNPDSWMDVVTILSAVLLAAAVPSWLTARANRAIREVHHQVRDVKEQVVNDHTNPLRADVDGLKTDLNDARLALSNLRDEVRGGFSSLRADLAEERGARRDGDSALRDEIRDRKSADNAERDARTAGDQVLRDDLDAHIDDQDGHQ